MGLGAPFQFVCVLLSSCTRYVDCTGCRSGPASCDQVDLVTLPQCLSYRHLSSYTRNINTVNNDQMCNGSSCCDITEGHFTSHAPPDWEGEEYYRFTGEAGTQIVEEEGVYGLCGTL